MFIELTDHLRCPADHTESYLVLLPDEMQDRSVRTGRLGCPVCGRTYVLTDGGHLRSTRTFICGSAVSANKQVCHSLGGNSWLVGFFLFTRGPVGFQKRTRLYTLIN